MPGLQAALADLPTPVLTPAQDGGSATEAEEFFDAADWDAEVAAVPTATSSSEDEALREPTGYVIAVTQKARFRRLHYVGRCHLRRGVDYKDFIPWGTQVPGMAEYHAVCRRCWPGSAEPEEEATADTETSSS